MFVNGTLIVATGYRGDGLERRGEVVPSPYPYDGLVTVRCLLRSEADRPVYRSYRVAGLDGLRAIQPPV